jgi:hypothetical protein
VTPGVDDASTGAGPEAAPPAALSPFARIAGIFVSPVETLRDVARRPDFVVPLLLIIVVSLACTAVAMQHIDFAADIRASLEESGRKLSPEQSDRSMKWGMAIGKTLAWMSPVLLPVWWAIYAGIVLLAFRMFGADMTYAQSFAIRIYSVLPGLLRGIITAIVVSTRGTVPSRSLATIVRSNAGFLIDVRTHPVLFTLATSLDVFALWALVLSIIGYAYAANVSRTRAALVIVSLFAIGLFFSVGFAAIGASMRSQ